METIAKLSVLACILATINAEPQVVAGPAYVHHAPYAPPHLHVPVVAHQQPFVRILSQNYESAPDGSYSFQYETEDGSSRQESGSPRYAQQPGQESYGGLAVQGRYAYASPEGPVEVQYTADENGYQPSGPSIHPDIQKAVAEQVAFARSEPAAGHVHVLAHPGPAAYRVPVPAYPTAYPSPLPPSPTPVVYKA